jgi:GTP diphosphokinase / guanosine-3',5'-bis(diphosphate) 3'-diphosphatase
MEQNIESIPLLLKAVSFAAEKHRHQRRKDVHASPYINHPISLASILTNEGGVTDINVLCAALLHDTIEDTDTNYDELIENFGENIASIVMEVTDDKALSKLERKQLQVEHAPHKSTEAKLVKWADKISNLRDIASSPPADWSIERKHEYFDWAKNVTDGMRGINPGLEIAFDAVYSEFQPADAP